jgi:hypothetical protein
MLRHNTLSQRLPESSKNSANLVSGSKYYTAQGLTHYPALMERLGKLQTCTDVPARTGICCRFSALSKKCRFAVEFTNLRCPASAASGVKSRPRRSHVRPRSTMGYLEMQTTLAVWEGPKLSTYIHYTRKSTRVKDFFFMHTLFGSMYNFRHFCRTEANYVQHESFALQTHTLV